MSAGGGVNSEFATQSSFLPANYHFEILLYLRSCIGNKMT